MSIPGLESKLERAGIAKSIPMYSARMVPREPWYLSLIFGTGAHIEVEHGGSHHPSREAPAGQARDLTVQVLE